MLLLKLGDQSVASSKIEIGKIKVIRKLELGYESHPQVKNWNWKIKAMLDLKWKLKDQINS